MTTEKSQKISKLLLCVTCDYSTCKPTEYKKHLLINNHNTTNTTEKSQKISKLLLCVTCDYSTCKPTEYKKHLLTNKHNTSTHPALEKEYICDCGKKYNHRASLFNHKKKCLIPEDEPIVVAVVDSSANELKLLTNLVIELVKGNTELLKSNTEIVKSNNDLQKQSTEIQKQVIDVCQKIQPTTNTNTNSLNTTTTTTTNSHNKTFNLQFFLNEECKDAMNMSDFIKSIEVKLSDLENIGKIGYVEGMSDIIIKQLKDTDVNKRPVHCSDAKRETLYVKEENKWEKDTEQMSKAVRDVDKKNYKLLSNWKDTHPNCVDSKSIQNTDYIKVVGEVMDGDEENVNKVIKKVAKQVVIDK